MNFFLGSVQAGQDVGQAPAMVMSVLLKNYHFTDAFLFLNWLQTLLPDLAVIHHLLAMLASIIHQYLKGDEVLNHTSFALIGFPSLDRMLVEKALAEEGLDRLLGPDLLVNIFRQLNDFPSCIQLAEQLGDVKAKILLRAIQKLNNSNSSWVFENQFFLDLDSFPPVAASKELNELLKIGTILTENILEMALEHVTNCMTDAVNSLEICIDQDCPVLWPLLHKLPSSCERLLENGSTVACQKRIELYTRWLWFLHFIKAANLSVNVIKSELPTIFDRVVRIVNVANLIIRFEKALRNLYTNPVKVKNRAEQVLQLGYLVLKYTSISRDIIGQCLQRALTELPAGRHHDYVTKFSGLAQKSQLTPITNDNRLGGFLLNSGSFILAVQKASISESHQSYFTWTPKSILSEVNDCPNVSVTEDSLISDEYIPNVKVLPQKKGLFRNLPLKTTKTPYLVQQSKLWAEIFSSRFGPSGLVRKLGLFLFTWYERASCLPWKSEAILRTNLELKLPTILGFLNSGIDGHVC